MQVSLERKEGLERTLRVDIPADRVQSAVDEKLGQLARNIRLDGFRPGKVPMRVVRNRFGGEVRREVLGELMQSSLQDAITQEELRPAGTPSVEADDTDDGGVTFRATFEVVPDIEVQGLAGVEIEKPVAEVTESDVDNMVETLRKQRKTFEDVDRPAASGDQIVIDFVGRKDGEAFEGGSGQDTPVELGAGRMIDGLEEGMEGMSAGETRTIDVTFPENYQASELAGETVQFEVTAKAVQEGRLPEVDEEFARGFGIESGSIDELRASLRGNMERELAQTLRGQVKERVLNALLEQNEIEVPSPMVTEEIGRMREQMKQRLGGQIPDAQLGDDMFREEATRRVRLGLLVAEVIRKAEIKADPERVKNQVEEIASSYEDPEQVAQYYFENREALSGVEAMVVEDLAVEHLQAQAEVTEKPSDFDTVMNRSS